MTDESRDWMFSFCSQKQETQEYMHKNVMNNYSHLLFPGLLINKDYLQKVY